MNISSMNSNVKCESFVNFSNQQLTVLKLYYIICFNVKNNKAQGRKNYD